MGLDVYKQKFNFVLCVCLCQNMSYAHYTHNYAVWVMGLAN